MAEESSSIYGGFFLALYERSPTGDEWLALRWSLAALRLEKLHVQILSALFRNTVKRVQNTDDLVWQLIECTKTLLPRDVSVSIIALTAIAATTTLPEGADERLREELLEEICRSSRQDISLMLNQMTADQMIPLTHDVEKWLKETRKQVVRDQIANPTIDTGLIPWLWIMGPPLLLALIWTCALLLIVEVLRPEWAFSVRALLFAIPFCPIIVLAAYNTWRGGKALRDPQVQTHSLRPIALAEPTFVVICIFVTAALSIITAATYRLNTQSTKPNAVDAPTVKKDDAVVTPGK